MKLPALDRDMTLEDIAELKKLNHITDKNVPVRTTQTFATAQRTTQQAGQQTVAQYRPRYFGTVTPGAPTNVWVARSGTKYHRQYCGHVCAWI